MSANQVHLDPPNWGPHFWFFLHTVSVTYPETPNDVTKRKYYDLIQNFPLFLPSGGSKFAEMIDKYPVTPYLDSRESFVRWVVFIHNKYNVWLGKPPMDLMDALDTYYNTYQSPLEKAESYLTRDHVIVLMLVGLCALYWYIR